MSLSRRGQWVEQGYITYLSLQILAAAAYSPSGFSVITLQSPHLYIPSTKKNATRSITFGYEVATLLNSKSDFIRVA